RSLSSPRGRRAGSCPSDAGSPARPARRCRTRSCRRGGRATRTVARRRTTNGARTVWSEPSSTSLPEIGRYSRNAPLGEPTQWSVTNMSTSDSFKAQLELCALQSAAPIALVHDLVNLSVHFCSFVASGAVPFAYPLAITPHLQPTFLPFAFAIPASHFDPANAVPPAPSMKSNATAIDSLRISRSSLLVFGRTPSA